MTPTDLRRILALAGWSQRELARRIGYTEGPVRAWARGAGYAPPDVANWLEAIEPLAADVAWHRAEAERIEAMYPPPPEKRWGTKGKASG